MWWRDAVIYQIYPRSFQDSNGDGLGDLPGILSRLDHIERLGASAIWLSPFYPSPNADFGYDVANYTAIDPDYGTLDDFDRLVVAAHERGLRVIVDFVPCHTSIEHPWFRERPDFYVWMDAPANNWVARFGGSAWERDPVTGRYYLHSFFPEQPDLNWRNPHVRAEMQSALRFWLERGGHLIAVNLGEETAPFKRRGELALETRRGDGADPDTIPAHAAWIARV